MMCSRSISSSLVLLLHWRISDGITPIVGPSLQPVLVEACCGPLPRHAERGDLLSEIRSFGDKFDAVGAHLPSAEDLRKRAEDLRNLPQKALKRQSNGGRRAIARRA
jgi:hypothetical protein